MTTTKEKTPHANEGFTTAPNHKKENELPNASLTATPDEVQNDRRMPVANLPEGFIFDRKWPRSVVVFDTHDQAGNNITCTSLPAEANWRGNAYPNDTLQVDGVTYTFRGDYWVDGIEDDPDTGEQMALLTLGSHVRCPKYDWCLGHTVMKSGKLDADLHLERLGTAVHTFTGDDAESNSMEIARMQGDDIDQMHASVTIAVEGEYDRAGMRNLAQELLAAADKLIEYGSHMEGN